MRFWVVLFIVDIALTVAALVSCLSAEEVQIRALPRVVWILIILLFSPVGAVAWFIAGREPVAAKPVWRQGSGFPEATRPKAPLAPDDDPEFLRRLSREQSEAQAADRALLAKWETDLRRREDELKKRTD